MRPAEFRNPRPENHTVLARRILLVHQNQPLREALAAKLIAAGFQVAAVANATAGIRAITQERPALVLLELTFPEPAAHANGVAWDSFLVMSWAGRFGAGSAIPFIALAGKDAHHDRDQALEAGAMDFLPLSSKDEDCLAAINRAFELAAVP